MAEDAAVITDSLAGAPLIFSNEQRERFAYTPAEFEVHVTGEALQRLYGLAHRLHLEAPIGWAVTEASRLVLDPRRAVTWRVRPLGEPPSCLVNLRLVIEHSDGESEVVHAIPVEVRGRTQFDPRRHALPFANSAAECGEVAPSPAVFRATYRRTPLPSVFFHGLYSEVVYLTGNSGRARPGGLCTGIARAALEFSLRHPDGCIADQDGATLRRMAAVWHGKQLADRALLASAAAWATRGSRDAFLDFRRRVLAGGTSDLAMDVDVPRPWRRDLPGAFIGSGHTVVPYAFRQGSDDRAEVWVYDPNHRLPEEMRDSVISFDLAGDTYRYRQYDGRRPGRPSKVLAVPQAEYRAADTAYLGTLASLVLYPRRWLPMVPAPALVAALVLCLAGLVRLAMGRTSRRSPVGSRQ